MTITSISLASENINSQNVNTTAISGGGQIFQNAQPTFLKLGVSFNNAENTKTDLSKAYQNALRVVTAKANDTSLGSRIKNLFLSDRQKSLHLAANKLDELKNGSRDIGVLLGELDEILKSSYFSKGKRGIELKNFFNMLYGMAKNAGYKTTTKGRVDYNTVNQLNASLSKDMSQIRLMKNIAKDIFDGTKKDTDMNKIKITKSLLNTPGNTRIRNTFLELLTRVYTPDKTPEGKSTTKDIELNEDARKILEEAGICIRTDAEENKMEVSEDLFNFLEKCAEPWKKKTDL